jgi:hypothetical protein
MSHRIARRSFPEKCVVEFSVRLARNLHGQVLVFKRKVLIAIGCGQHIDSALAGLTPEQICHCKDNQGTSNTTIIKYVLLAILLYVLYYLRFENTAGKK